MEFDVARIHVPIKNFVNTVVEVCDVAIERHGHDCDNFRHATFLSRRETLCSVRAERRRRFSTTAKNARSILSPQLKLLQVRGDRSPHTAKLQLLRERRFQKPRAERIMASPPATPSATRVQMKNRPPGDLATVGVNPLFRWISGMPSAARLPRNMM